MNQILKTYKIKNDLRLDRFHKKDIASGNLAHKRFYKHIKSNGNFGINIKPAHFLDVLNSKKYLNIFQLNYSEEEIKNKYRSAWGNEIDYYSRLNFFIGLFDENRLIKYCSLNTGNLGLTHRSFGGSGSIYLVLDKKYVEKVCRKNEAFALKTFSLHFFSEDDDFMEEEFSNSVSSVSKAPELCVEKHFEIIPKVQEEYFPDLVAGISPYETKSDAIEIIVYSDITLKHIKEFKIGKRRYYSVKNTDLIKASKSRATRKRILTSIEESCSENGIKMVLV